MDVPDLARVCETFLRIGASDDLRLGRHVDTLRADVLPLVRALQSEGLIDWYCFLIHQRPEVPVPEGDDDFFWHVRLELQVDRSFRELTEALPEAFEMTRMVERKRLLAMSGLDESKFVGGIQDAWRVLGEQSEWLLRTLEAHKSRVTTAELSVQLGQYLHYFANMTSLRVV